VPWRSTGLPDGVWTISRSSRCGPTTFVTIVDGAWADATGFVPSARPDGSEDADLHLAPAAFQEAFAGDVDAATAAAMAAAQRRHDLRGTRPCRLRPSPATPQFCRSGGGGSPSILPARTSSQPPSALA
jgi:hypothetical protein